MLSRDRAFHNRRTIVVPPFFRKVSSCRADTFPASVLRARRSGARGENPRQLFRLRAVRLRLSESICGGGIKRRGSHGEEDVSLSLSVEREWQVSQLISGRPRSVVSRFRSLSFRFCFASGQGGKVRGEGDRFPFYSCNARIARMCSTKEEEEVPLETLTFNRRSTLVQISTRGKEKEKREKGTDAKWTRYVRHVAAVRLSFRHFRVIPAMRSSSLSFSLCSSPEGVSNDRYVSLQREEEEVRDLAQEKKSVEKRERGDFESQESGTWVFEVRSTRLTGVDQISEDEIIQGRQRSRQSSFRGRIPPPPPPPLPPPDSYFLSLSLSSASANFQSSPRFLAVEIDSILPVRRSVIIRARPRTRARLINSIIVPDWIIFSGDEGKKRKKMGAKKITNAASRRCNATTRL